MPPDQDEAAVARECARLMYADDSAARHLGIQIEDVSPGCATLTMRVRDEFANGHGMCHGGYVFLLADTAFAYACNSRNQRAVAASATIDFLAPAARGDVLRAIASETNRTGRGGLYDIRVTDQNGRLVAVFRGRSAHIKGTFVESSR